MAITFPVSIDSLTNPTATSDTNVVDHATQHANLNDAVEALEAKVGVDSSAVATSLDYLVKSTSSSDPGHKHTLANGATDVTASAAEVNVLDGIPVTLTATELGYVDGVTSAIQTQLDTKAPLNSPTLVTPTLGVATATSINKVTITAPATSATLTLVTGSSLITSGAYAITLTATNTTGVTLPTTGTLSTLAGTETFTNKRITPRVVTATDDATAVIDCDVTDQYQLTAVANATEFTVTGTPVNGQKLIIRLKDAGVGKGLTWTGFTAIGVTLPTTTVANKTHYIGCIYNSAASTWDAVAVLQEA